MFCVFVCVMLHTRVYTTSSDTMYIRIRACAAIIIIIIIFI